MTTNFCKMARDHDVISRFEENKAMAQEEFKEVPDINFRTILLVLILILQKYNEE